MAVGLEHVSVGEGFWFSWFLFGLKSFVCESLGTDVVLVLGAIQKGNFFFFFGVSGNSTQFQIFFWQHHVYSTFQLTFIDRVGSSFKLATTWFWRRFSLPNRNLRQETYTTCVLKFTGTINFITLNKIQIPRKVY